MQHARRPLVRLHHADRVARLHEQRLVALRGSRACARARRSSPSRARPCRCRRRRRARRGARRPRGRGCSAACAARPPAASRACAARCRGARGRGGVLTSSIEVSLLSDVVQQSDSSTTARPRAAISGARYRSGPGPGIVVAHARRSTAAVHGRGRLAAQLDAARGGQQLDREHALQTVDRRGAACARRDQPIETWSSCIALVGIESTDAGAARRLSSLTIPACVYCAIMWPESTPGSSARNGRQPAVAGLVEEPVGATLAHARDIGDRDREEVEHVPDRGTVEVAVRLEPSVERDDRVVDRARELAAGDDARRGRRCRARRRAPAARSAASTRPARG